MPPANVERCPLLSQMPLPEQLTVQRQGSRQPGAKPNVNPLAVRHATGARQVVLEMNRRKMPAGFEDLLPDHSPVAPRERLYRELHAAAGLSILCGLGVLEIPSSCPGAGAEL